MPLKTAINADPNRVASDDETAGAAPSRLLTVVTVTYNAGPAIRRTIESVLPHLDNDVEYVIVDGGSTDGTAEIVQQYASHLSSWISEPDKGIYDAMNKAARLATGRFILHINCGDELLAVPKQELRQADASVGCMAFPVRQGASIFRPSAGILLNIHNTLHHQGCFYAKALTPPYDLQYRVFSDFALNLQLKRTGTPISIGSELVASHEKDGVSNSTQRFREVYDIVLKQRGHFWMAACFIYFKWRGVMSRVRHAA